METLPNGFKAMVPAILILIFAWTLKNITMDLGAKEYVHDFVYNQASGFQNFLPAIVFLIGCLLAFVSIVLLRETKGLLIGEGLNLEELQRVEAVVEADPNVVECGRILSLYLGPHDLLQTIDVTFDETAGRDSIDRSIDAIERGIVRELPQTTRIFIEPENLRTTSAATVQDPS